MTDNYLLINERTTAVTGDQKVEVEVNGEEAVIRMYSYSDGIGWFAQKTITVDANVLDALADQFSAARGKIKREGDEILSADLLEF